MSTADVVQRRLDSAVTPLRGLCDQIERGGVGSAEVSSLLERVRSLERHCAAIASALAEVAHAHYKRGHGPPVEEVMETGSQVSSGQARAEAARVDVLEAFPSVRSAVRAGAAYPANVDVLARLIAEMTDAEVQQMAEADPEIAECAGRLGSASFGRRVRRMRDNVRRDHGMDAARRNRRACTAQVGPHRDGDGYFVHARLDSEQGAAFLDGFQKSLRRLESELGANHGLSRGELAALALVEPYVRGVNTTPTFENTGAKVVVNVLTDMATLEQGPHDRSITETFDSQPLAPTQLSRLCCDATLRRISTLPDGSVNVSHSGRTATPAQRAALRSLYPGCAITGSPWSQVEIHHVVYFRNCRETALSNLIPISKRWHHLIHDRGWRLEMDPDRTLRLYKPDQSLHRTIPPPLPLNQEHRGGMTVRLATDKPETAGNS